VVKDESKIYGEIPPTKYMKPWDISGIKRGNIWKTELMSLQWTVRTRKLESCIEEYI
jgi:hypothetical protein